MVYNVDISFPHVTAFLNSLKQPNDIKTAFVRFKAIGGGGGDGGWSRP